MSGNNDKTRNGRSIVMFMMLASLLLTIISTAQAATVELQWDSNSESDLAGYRVYYAAGALVGPMMIDVGNQTTATVSGLDPAYGYSFAVTAYNASNQESSYSNIVTVSEMQSPTAAITIPANGATVTGSVNFTAAASDNIGVTKVEYFLNNNLVGTDTSTPYVYSWDTLAATPGSYTLLVKAYDAAGNVGQSSPVTVTVAIDTTAPAVSVAAPANGTTVSGTVNITASANDNVGVNMVEIYINGAMRAVVNSAPFTFNWNTTLENNGTYNLTAKAYDAANNAATSSAVTVSVNNIVPDTAAPSASVTAPATGATVSGTVNVTASATDNVGVSKVEFFVNGSLAATDSSSPYSYSWNTTAIANGTYNLTAKAYDAANNATTSSAVTVSINNVLPDTTAPSASVTAPATGATVSGTVNVTASANDNVGVSKVEFFVNGSLAATDSNSPYSFSWNTVAVANGTFNLTVKAYDASNNATISSAVTVSVNNVLVDTTAPVVTLDDSPSMTAAISAQLSGSATDNVGVSAVSVKVGNQSPVAATISGGAWSCSVSGLIIGDNTVVVTAVDAKGNATSSAKTINRYLRGDLNGDGVVNILDAQKAQKIAVGKQRATAEQLLRGDVAPLVNSAPQPNGVIDTGDVIVIQNIAVGNIVL